MLNGICRAATVRGQPVTEVDRLFSLSTSTAAFMWPCIVTNFFIIKPTRCTSFPNLLRHETIHVSGSSSAHHQQFIHCALYTVHCVPSWSCSKAVYKPVWHIPLPSVQWINYWWWAEEMSETCIVSCRSKFGKLVHLVGFIIRKSTTALYALHKIVPF